MPTIIIDPPGYGFEPIHDAIPYARWRVPRWRPRAEADAEIWVLGRLVYVVAVLLIILSLLTHFHLRLS